MSIQVRYGTFETNSSSTHSLVICTAEEYDMFRRDELRLDSYKGVFKSVSDFESEEEYIDETVDYETYVNSELESFVSRYTTKLGENIVVFGRYGYDG